MVSGICDFIIFAENTLAATFCVEQTVNTAAHNPDKHIAGMFFPIKISLLHGQTRFFCTVHIISILSQQITYNS